MTYTHKDSYQRAAQRRTAILSPWEVEDILHSLAPGRCHTRTSTVLHGSLTALAMAESDAGSIIWR